MSKCAFMIQSKLIIILRLLYLLEFYELHTIQIKRNYVVVLFIRDVLSPFEALI